MREMVPPAGRSARPLPAISVACTGPGSITVRITGELDAVGAPVLESELERVWSRDARRVTIDLSAVTFLGLPGLHCLVRAMATARERHVRLSVAAGSRHVYRLLELAGATEIAEPPTGAPRAQAIDPPDRPDGAAHTATGRELEPVLRALRWKATHPTGDLRETLRSVTETAAAYLPGAAGAGVLLAAGPGRVESYAATDPVVTILDLVQQRSRGGPAWQSAWTGVDVVVDDVVVDPRWPEVVAETARLGVRSLLCLCIGPAEHPVGALTVYSSVPAALQPAAHRLGHAFASVAAIAVDAHRAAADQSEGATDPTGSPSASITSVRSRGRP